MSYSATKLLIAISLTATLAFAVTPIDRARATPVLQTSGSLLTGVSGLDVDGQTYNVSFQDGTCTAVFGGCTSAQFAFHTQASALSASSALLGAISAPPAFYESNPNSIRGCGDQVGPACTIITPYSTEFITDRNGRLVPFVADSVVVFGSRGGPFAAASGGVNPTLDTAAQDALVYAVWGQSIVLQGGTSSKPVNISAPNVGQINGSIGGFGSTDFYEFAWAGGDFSANAAIAGANAGAVYEFELLNLSGEIISQQILNFANDFVGAIDVPLLASNYVIGLVADNPNDPDFSITFTRPVSGVPEPSSLALFGAGLAGLYAFRRKRKTGKATSTF